MRYWLPHRYMRNTKIGTKEVHQKKKVLDLRVVETLPTCKTEYCESANIKKTPRNCSDEYNWSAAAALVSVPVSELPAYCGHAKNAWPNSDSCKLLEFVDSGKSATNSEPEMGSKPTTDEFKIRQRNTYHIIARIDGVIHQNRGNPDMICYHMFHITMYRNGGRVHVSRFKCASASESKDISPISSTPRGSQTRGRTTRPDSPASSETSEAGPRPRALELQPLAEGRTPWVEAIPNVELASPN